MIIQLLTLQASLTKAQAALVDVDSEKADALAKVDALSLAVSKLEAGMSTIETDKAQLASMLQMAETESQRVSDEVGSFDAIVCPALMIKCFCSFAQLKRLLNIMSLKLLSSRAA